MNARKIATSVPAEQFKAIERVRRRLRLKRSQVVQEALWLWLSTREQDERVARYIKGYLTHPDDAKEARAAVRAWATGLDHEQW